MLNPKFIEMYGERVAEAYRPIIEECAKRNVEVIFYEVNPEVDGLKIPRMIGVSVNNPKLKSALFKVGLSLVRTISDYEKRDLISIGTFCDPFVYNDIKKLGDVAWVG